MNKKLMALAVAGAVTAPGLAVAQVGSSPGVTLYGRLDETIVNQKFSTNAAGNVSELKKGDVWSPGSAIGVRGREDLGGGTAVWFQLEAGAWPDGRLDNAATSGQHFGGRNSGLGVSSELGDIMFGGWDQPYKTAYNAWNLVTSGGFSAAGILMGNGDTTGALTNVLCQTTVSNTNGSIQVPNATNSPAQGSCVTEATSNGTAWSRRTNNSIQYWSPVFAGLQFRLGTALATYQSPGTAQLANGLPKAKSWSGSVAWARGPLSLGGGYEAHEGLRPSTSATGVVNPKDTAFQVGGKWNFGLGEVGVGLEKLSYAQNNNGSTAAAPANGLDTQTYVLNGRLNAGPGAVWASYSTTKGKNCTVPSGFNPSTGAGNTTVGSNACGSAGDAKMTVLGYDYVMSKRTKMYVAYAKIDNGKSTNFYYIAGPAGNNGGTLPASTTATQNGTASGVATGTDVTTIGVGLQHSF
jgi:predicted porin